MARKGLRFIGTVRATSPPPNEIREQPRLALPLPDRPAIAVLPFINMSGDPEQEYFSDGISEDIITALSKLRWFFVIARNSSFIYKGKVVHMKQVAEELGVGYVIEGSVRKSGDRVRITVQLNDVATGSHIWAERYDRSPARSMLPRSHCGSCAARSPIFRSPGSQTTCRSSWTPSVSIIWRPSFARD